MDALDPEMSAAPQAMFKALRDESPVLRMGDGVAVTRRGDIDEVFRCPEIFSSNMSAVDLGNIRPLIPLQIDPPDHVRYRRILDPLFAPRQMALLEPQVAALVHDLIDGFVDNGECNLAEAFTVPLPSQVFLVLLGLPLSELDRFLRIKDGIIRPQILYPEAQTLDQQQEIRRQTAQEIYEYFDATLDEREKEPRDDLLTKLLATEVDGERLSRHEILDTCFLFLIAGLDTVSASLECFFAYLAQHPEQRRRLVEDPDVVAHAVEELLRWESPVSGVARIAVADTELSGEPIKEGDQVFVLIGSGNTDEAQFADADVVDFDRESNRHVAFGGGIHRCLGSHLARLELRVALREFHRRIPDYSLAPGASLEYTPGIRSIADLPIRWSV
ncbi:MAG: cytochrome P450 [Acidimicrobiales bacterium]